MAKTLVEVVNGAGEKVLVRSVDAKEIEAQAKAGASPEEVVEEKAEEVVVDPAAFPANFPGAAVLTKEGVGHHQALRMTKDELLEVKGIGPKVADEILKLRK
jgi:predicted flap endonuclease-1-like 5' DNA nuclease